MKHSIFDVFTPAKPAIVNFVERDELNATLVDNIRTPGMQVILEGSVGNGKSTLIMNKLNQLYENYLIVDCLEKYSAVDLLIQAFDNLNQFYTSEIEDTREKNAKGGISKDFFLSLSFDYEKKKSIKNKEQRAVPMQISPINLVRTLSKINSCLLIENIHRLKKSEIGEVFSYMKLFSDTIENNVVKIICTSTQDQRELQKSYPYLANRIAVIKIGRLNPDQLRLIIENGMNLLNIQFNKQFIEKTIIDSKGEARSIHEICLRNCLENEIYETAEELMVIE